MKNLYICLTFLSTILYCTSAHALLSEDVDLSFSHTSGYYEESFTLHISSVTNSATIIYTLDGSNPQTSTTSLIGSSNVSVNIDPNSTINRSKTPGVLVRASLKVGGVLSFPISRTFIFMDAVMVQTKPGIAWPSSSLTKQMMDYEMDPEIVNSVQYGALLDDALLGLPTLSVMTDNSNLFDSNTGIYVNAPFQGYEWERPCAVELLDYNGIPGFNVNAGLRIRGGASRKPQFPKHSLRLFFREEYGVKKLNYPLFGDGELSSFEKIDLSSPQSHCWSEDASEQTTFLRDIFAREAQGDAGRVHTQSCYYHLYLNGMYWGIYQTQERADANFGADYWGGDAEDYDVIKIKGMREDGSGTDKYLEASDGTMDKWAEIYELCNFGFQDDEDYFFLEGKDKYGKPIKGAEIYVDIDNLIDYMINIFYTGNYDASPSQWTNNRLSNNMVAITNRVDKSEGFKFIIHDAEYALFVNAFGPGIGLEENRVNIGDLDYWYSMRADDITAFHIQWLHFKLSDNAEYRLRFADRACEQLTGDGIFTPAKNLERINCKAAEIDTAIIAESARWGDGNDGSYEVRTKDNSWLPAINEIRNDYFPYRTDIVIDQLAEYDLFPSIIAPVFKDNNGAVLMKNHSLISDLKVNLTHLSSNGDLYYTLDGSDPRTVGGGVSSTAFKTAIGSRLTISSSTVLKARVKQGNDWGALASSVLMAEQMDFSHFKVTELNYHPQEEVVDMDTLGAKKYEFIEFKNTSATAFINLTGVVIDSGIYYEFPDNFLLGPKTYFVVASKPRFFFNRYGYVSSGNFKKNLSNSSEKIVVFDAKGTPLIDFTYNDDYPWPENADGKGPSLCSSDIDPVGDPNDPAYWKHSTLINGTPFGNDETLSSINENTSASSSLNMSLFPNPTDDVVNIELSEFIKGYKHLELYNINGALLYQEQFYQKTDFSFNKLRVDHGFYLIKVYSGEKRLTTKVIYAP